MNFLHVSLVAGIAMALVPILIHFSGRKQPKPVIFPALRFVQSTKLVAARGWNVKRWLLLLLRVLLLALAALALASPRVNGASFASWIMIGLLAILGIFAAVASLVSFTQNKNTTVSYATLFVASVLIAISALWGTWVLLRGPAVTMQSSSGPVAAAIIVDVSPAMAYRTENQTQLEKAKEYAEWIVDRLDAQSQIGILTDSYNDRLVVGHANAKNQLERLQVGGRPTDLQSQIAKAVELVRTSEVERTEIYVVTDMGTSQWNQADRVLPSILEDDTPILLQIIDVGREGRRNWAIDQVQLSQDVVSVNSVVQVQATIKSAPETPSDQIIVELRAETKDAALPTIRDGELVTPSEVVVERKIVDSAGAGDSFQVSFQLSNIQLGTNHYSLAITSVDPLDIDDRWPFTIDGVKGGETLVIDGGSTSSTDSSPSVNAEILSSMIDPAQSAGNVVDLEQFKRIELSDTSFIALHNPIVDLDALTLERLEGFVARGGGLLVILGDSISPNQVSGSGETGGLMELLPGRLARLTRRPTADVHLETTSATHGALREFGSEVARIPWSRFPIYRHWDIEDLSPAAVPILSYTISGMPALIEEVRGIGRIITLTTPVPDIEFGGHEPWNELTTQAEAWPSFGLILGTARYLQISSESQRNFEVSENAFVEWSDSAIPSRFELFHPDGTLEQVSTDQKALVYNFTNKPGHYRLRGLLESAKLLKGFSVHLPASATDLTRISAEGLDEKLGESNYLIANDKESLRESIGQGRFGRNLSPFLLLLITGIYLAEQAMSQHYYSSKRFDKAKRRT